MKRVLIDKPIHPAALTQLKQEAETVEAYRASIPELRELIADVEGLIVSAVWKIGESDIIGAARLEVIGRPGAGVDSVDVAACSAAGIPLVYTPGAPTESVAEHALCMMLMLVKRFRPLEAGLRRGDFSIRTQVIGGELQGKTVGIVGFGAIGRRLAEICGVALGMHVLVFDPFVDAEKARSLGVESVPLEELMARADVVSVHTPLTPETRHLIGRGELGAMKPTAVLINTSRGPVVDETALIGALQTGRIAGAGLDVFDQEPPPAENPLLHMDNVVVTPHCASFTDEARARMGLAVVLDVLRILRGERPTFIVNPEVWSRRRVAALRE